MLILREFSHLLRIAQICNFHFEVNEPQFWQGSYGMISQEKIMFFDHGQEKSEKM